MLSTEQRKRLQTMTPERRKRIALLAIKKIKEKQDLALKVKPQQK